MSSSPGNDQLRNARDSFTMIRDPAVDSLIAEMLACLRQDLATLSPGPAAVFLGGGYGRGDGGVMCRGGRRLPYNDLDFFVFSDGMDKRSRHALDAALSGLAETWSTRLGIDVDFSPARELKALSRMPVTLMLQELREGHVLVWGSEEVIQRIQACPAQDLPVLEGLRLFLNRGTGLLLAARRLAEQRDDDASRDFIWRNLHKCALGCGDGLFILTHCYDYSLQRRQAALAAWTKQFWPDVMGDQLTEHYCRAVAFKGQPHDDSLLAAGDVLAELRHLWLASLERGMELCGKPAGCLDRQRLRQALAALSGRDRWWKNWLQNVVYGLASGVGTGCFMPPQCWLLQTLAGIHSGDLGSSWEEAGGLDWFLYRWRRFN